MRRTLIALTMAGALTASGCAATSTASQPPAPAHRHAATAPATGGGRLAAQLARARLATARYATSLRAAKADGYQILTPMIPDMGWHFLNPEIQGFDVTRPPILVYERHRRSWQLAAFEWVFPTKPATPPLPGATYGSFGAACHYTDGTFVPGFKGSSQHRLVEWRVAGRSGLRRGFAIRGSCGVGC